MENVDALFNSVVSCTIKRYRKENRMSLDDVVKDMKNSISRQALFKYENGKARIKMETFLDICDALKIDFKAVFDDINLQTMEIAHEISIENAFHADANLFDLVEKKFNDVQNFADSEIIASKTKKIYLNQLQAYNELDKILEKYKHILSSNDIEYFKQVIKIRKNHLYKQLEE